MAPSRVNRFLAKALFIDTDSPSERADLALSRLNSVLSTSTANFVEKEPTVWEWIRDTFPTRHTAANYIKSLFPFTAYILHYNLQWLTGDFIAGEHQVPRV